MQRTSPPSCGARGHRPIFAARDCRSAQKLRSAKWCQSKFYDSNVCHIAPRVLGKCLVHALSALVENMKVLIGCEYWCEPPSKEQMQKDQGARTDPRVPLLTGHRHTIIEVCARPWSVSCWRRDARHRRRRTAARRLPGGHAVTRYTVVTVTLRQCQWQPRAFARDTAYSTSTHTARTHAHSHTIHERPCPEPRRRGTRGSRGGQLLRALLPTQSRPSRQ